VTQAIREMTNLNTELAEAKLPPSVPMTRRRDPSRRFAPSGAAN